MHCTHNDKAFKEAEEEQDGMAPPLALQGGGVQNILGAAGSGGGEDDDYDFSVGDEQKRHLAQIFGAQAVQGMDNEEPPPGRSGGRTEGKEDEGERPNTGGEVAVYDGAAVDRPGTGGAIVAVGGGRAMSRPMTGLLKRLQTGRPPTTMLGRGGMGGMGGMGAMSGSQSLTPQERAIKVAAHYTLTITIHSLYTHYTLTRHSLHTHYTLTTHSLHTHYTLTTHSLHTHYTLTVLRSLLSRRQ
jgi:hypothetical protein